MNLSLWYTNGQIRKRMLSRLVSIYNSLWWHETSGSKRDMYPHRHLTVGRTYTFHYRMARHPVSRIKFFLICQIQWETQQHGICTIPWHISCRALLLNSPIGKRFAAKLVLERDNISSFASVFGWINDSSCMWRGMYVAKASSQEDEFGELNCSLPETKKKPKAFLRTYLAGVSWRSNAWWHTRPGTSNLKCFRRGKNERNVRNLSSKCVFCEFSHQICFLLESKIQIWFFFGIASTEKLPISKTFLKYFNCFIFHWTRKLRFCKNLFKYFCVFQP